VLLAAYSAALISSLTVYRSNLPFEDLEGILRDRTYKLGVLDKSEMYYTVSVRWRLAASWRHGLATLLDPSLSVSATTSSRIVTDNWQHLSAQFVCELTFRSNV
jgi:hypothetical protein